MAAQLTRKGLRGLVSGGSPKFKPSPRLLSGAVASCLVLAFASVIVAAHNANRDEAAADTRYHDAQALIALPPASHDSIQQDLGVVNQQLATAEAGLAPPNIDPASDDLTSLLVRSAGDAGLAVKGVARANPGQATVGDAPYNVQSLHINVSGSVGQITVFLRGLAQTEPALVPSLASMTANDAGVATADIVFSAYAPVPMPTAVPAAKGARR